MDLVLIRLVDMSFNEMFSNPHCRHTRPTCGSGLIMLIYMSFKEMFSNPHCRHTRHTCGSGLNQIPFAHISPRVDDARGQRLQNIGYLIHTSCQNNIFIYKLYSKTKLSSLTHASIPRFITFFVTGTHNLIEIDWYPC